ncbi:hypothetical protein [Absidia glauca]|nr:hypothetical protein [Absidia glauca]
MNGRRLARSRILQIKGLVETESLRFRVHLDLIKTYIKEMSIQRSIYIASVKAQLQAYAFDEQPDELPPYTSTSELFQHIRQKGRFLHKDFDDTNGIFTSTFFVTMYEQVYMNKLSPHPKLPLKDTCSSSMCLLLAAIHHCITMKIVPDEDAPKTSEHFRIGCVAEWIYHRLLEEDDPANLPSLNRGEPIDWPKEVEAFKLRLQQKSKRSDTSLGLEERNDATLNSLAFD